LSDGLGRMLPGEFAPCVGAAAGEGPDLGGEARLEGSACGEPAAHATASRETRLDAMMCSGVMIMSQGRTNTGVERFHLGSHGAAPSGLGSHRWSFLDP